MELRSAELGLQPAAAGTHALAAGGLAAGAAPHQRIDRAVNGLRQQRPEFSASASLTLRQRTLVAGFAIAVMATAAAAPQASRELALACLAIPFFFVVLIRVAALWQFFAITRRPAVMSGRSEPCDADLPRYSLLVPLYREAESAPGLIEALGALDYPTDRLEIFFVTESEDEATRAALETSGLEPHMRILAVPGEQPRTKPKALNYALTFASGDYVGIYDAEDNPDPRQLRCAVAAFRAGGPELACVQAHLNIYNPGKNFLTRQFTLEYTALFDCILPALDRLKLPLPLGGTSNHFDRRMLEAAGAWDPFNVTEDADLGVRLARLGKRVAMIESTTWEEAPETFPGWIGQRSRWIKGWMQTYMVHMREPVRTARELGPWAFAGFQLVFAGLILSALVHPWFYAELAVRSYNGTPFVSAADGWHETLWWLCCINLLAAYVASIALAALSVTRRGGRLLVRPALGLPVYWLAISAASYVALAEIVWRPHHWTKTRHTGSGRGDVRHSRETSQQ